MLIPLSSLPLSITGPDVHTLSGPLPYTCTAVDCLYASEGQLFAHKVSRFHDIPMHTQQQQAV